MRGNLYSVFATRLALAAVVLSGGFGGATYWLEQRAMTRSFVTLAEAEAHAFATVNRTGWKNLLAAPAEDVERRLAAFLASRQSEADGHFTVAELYDANRRSLGEATQPGATIIEDRIDSTEHAFPQGTRPWHDQVKVGDALFIRIVVPLFDAAANRLGFFEGVYELSAARRREMQGAAIDTVLGVISVVLATTLFLAPVIMALNRHLLDLSRKLLKANLETLELLGGAIAKRDSDTHHHNYRVTLYAVSLAENMGLDPAFLQNLIKGAFLHDVGKIAISDAILLKPGRLTPEEFEVMKTHVEHGVDIIARSDWLNGANPVVRHHHEKFDGSGYPDGLKGDAIPLAARIFAIADVFDALTSRRPYKAPMPFEKAMAILQDGQGTHFDPGLVARFAAIIEPLYRRFGHCEDDSVKLALDAHTIRHFGV